MVSFGGYIAGYREAAQIQLYLHRVSGQSEERRTQVRQVQTQRLQRSVNVNHWGGVGRCG